MRNVLLLFVATAVLVSLGLAQTATPVAMTLTAASIKGCLGGSDGAYTVAQDGSSQTFKITSSSVDLKPHIGHQVELTGQKSSAAVVGSPETVSVTGVSMISEHCPMAAASTPTAADPATATLGASATMSTPAAAPAATPAPEAGVAAKPVEPATTTTTTTVSTPAVAPVAAVPAVAPVVLASATTPLPNTAPAPLKAIKVTGKVGDDGKTFVSDKDSKSWTVTNPDAVKGHEGHHVTLTAHLDAVKSEVEIVSLKMAK